MNAYFFIDKDEYKIKSDEKLSWHEMGERILQWAYGEDAEKVEKQGYATWHKPVDDVYWRWNIDTRVPVYMEFFLVTKEEAQKIGDEVGLELDWGQYSPFPGWHVPTSHKELDDEFDMLGFSYRDILHTNNTTTQNPYLDEVSQLCPYTYTITINTDVAGRKGLKNGDAVYLENRYGKKEKGVLKTLQGQHPKTLAIAGQAGLWAKGRPIARGKGSNFCKLLPSYLRHYDPVTGGIETSVALKIYKALD
jgi:thiosulfate reductase/polysulfide reductase chain A